MTDSNNDTNTDSDTSDSNTVNTGLGTVATDMYSFINDLLSFSVEKTICFRRYYLFHCNF